MHIHVPDGVLPVWLWLAGFIVLVPCVGAALWRVRSDRRRMVRASMVSAVLLVVFSIELFGFHLNLTSVAGILLGPWWSLLSLLILNVFLSLFGHGGITIIGLNTLLTWIEALIGWSLFEVSSAALRKQPLLVPGSAGAIAFLALSISFLLFVGMVAASNTNPGEFVHEHEAGEADHEQEELVSLPVFLAVSAPLFLIGAGIEAVLSALVVGYIIRARPGLLYGVRTVPHRP